MFVRKDKFCIYLEAIKSDTNKDVTDVSLNLICSSYIFFLSFFSCFGRCPLLGGLVFYSYFYNIYIFFFFFFLPKDFFI